MLSLPVDMTLEDPFFVVKDEVFKALNKTRGLYLRWQEILKYPTSPVSPEVDWITTELRNALRSIEWDLEDLEDTINIVEKNFTKFKIDDKELSNRKSFIETTRQEVKGIKNAMNFNRRREYDESPERPLLHDESPSGFLNISSSTPKYGRLPNLYDSRFDDENTIGIMQENMLSNQNDQIELIGNTVESLNTVSRQIGIELDEHAIMLDDFNADLENTDSKFQSMIRKVQTVLHMTNSRRQWCTIVILIVILFIVLILFIIL